MSFFLIFTVAIAAGAAVLVVRRRSQRTASRSGRYRSPKAGLNLDRPAGLSSRSRREGGSRSNSLAGPVFLALVVVVMVFWVVAAFFLPEGQGGAAMVSEPKADASPPEQFTSLAGRLSSEPASAGSGPGVMAQAAVRASGPALPPSQAPAPADGPLMVAALSMAPAGSSHLGQVGLQAGRVSSGPSAKPAPAKTAPAQPAQPTRNSAAAPAAKNPAPAAAPAAPAPPASGARSSVVSAASASSAPRAAASGAIAPANPPRSDGGQERRAPRPAQDEGALASTREFTVHLGSFTDQTNAEKYKSKLDSVGETAFISQVTMEGRLWFRVMSGRFNTRAAAEAHGKDLKRRSLTVDTGRYLIKSLD